MSSQFNKSYRVTPSSVLSANLWNSVFQNIDQRLIGIEEKKASFEEAEKQLLEVGLRRINETIGPAAEKIINLSELGFMVASSEELIKPVDGQALSIHLSKGTKSELFTPSPFIALVRRSTPDDYAIGRLLHYDRDLARVDMNIVAVQGDMGPHDDFDVAALAGSVKAMWDALQESRQIRDDVTAKHSDIAQKSTDITAKHGQVVTKHGDFISTWLGARTTQPQGGKTGAMYLDIGKNPARVMVRSPTGWVIAAIASNNVYTKAQADAKFLTQENAQFLPLSGGTLNGDLTVTGTLKGDEWQEWDESGHAKAAISARAGEIADQKINARCVTDVRLTGWVVLGSGALHWTYPPEGYVSVAGNKNGTFSYQNLGCKQLQIKVPDIGWRAVSSDDDE